MRYLNPKADLTFKRVFGEHPDLVMSLLNALLPLEEKHEITDIEYLSAEIVPDNPLRKNSIVDVRCKDTDGRQFIVSLLYIGLLFVFALSGSCVEKRDVTDVFDRAERCMDVSPDSALRLLEQIPRPEQLRGKQQADYALLLTQARDKNYLDSLQSDSLIRIAVDYYKDGDDDVKAGKALFYYGKVAALQGNDMVAMQAYLEALTKLKATKEYKLLGFVHEYMGILNMDRKLYKDATGNYQDAVRCFQQADDTLGVIYVYRDIARIYYAGQQYDSVYSYIDRALSLCGEKRGTANFERVIPSLLQVKGIAKRNEGDLGDAIALLKTAIEAERDKHSMHHYSMSLGNIYLSLNEPDEAKKCFSLALSSEKPHTLAGAYHYLYLLAKKQKKHAEALCFKEKSDSLLAIARDAKQTSKILTLQREYEREKLILEKLQVEREKQVQLYWGLSVVLFIILLCLVLYFLLRKKYEELFRKDIEIIDKNECMIKRYVYELGVLKQKSDETAEAHREKIGELSQKIVLLESENKAIRENVCVNGTYILEQLKKKKLLVKNMTKQEKEQLLEYMDLIYGNLISRLKTEFKLTSGNLMLIALLKAGFTSNELMFVFDCELNSIFTKKRRLKESLNLDTNDKLEEFIALY